MRTTLTIPDDVLVAARQRAEAQGVTVGEALGEIARRGLETELEECEDGFWKGVKFFRAAPASPESLLNWSTGSGMKPFDGLPIGRQYPYWHPWPGTRLASSGEHMVPGSGSPELANLSDHRERCRSDHESIVVPTTDDHTREGS